MTNRIILLLSIMLLSACASGPLAPEQKNLFVDHAFKLEPCPDAPNCVSTEAVDERHKIAPFKLKMSLVDAWPLIVKATDSSVARVSFSSLVVQTEGLSLLSSRISSL